MLCVHVSARELSQLVKLNTFMQTCHICRRQVLAASDVCYEDRLAIISLACLSSTHAHRHTGSGSCLYVNTYMYPLFGCQSYSRRGGLSRACCAPGTIMLKHQFSEFLSRTRNKLLFLPTATLILTQLLNWCRLV